MFEMSTYDVRMVQEVKCVQDLIDKNKSKRSDFILDVRDVDDVLDVEAVKDELTFGDLERSITHCWNVSAISFCHVFEANHVAPRARNRPIGRSHEVKQ